jgi:hypothetical protein
MSVQLAIPASQLVAVNPGVITAAGAAVDLLGLFLTSSTRIPIGTVQSFATQAAVGAFFGGSSPEAAKAAIYFLGFDNSALKPAAMLFAQCPYAGAVPAYLRGGNISGLTLAQLQAITGTLIITIDGLTFTSGSIDLSGAGSFSAAAALIQTALGAVDATFTAAIAATTMTVSAVATGELSVGQVVAGAGVTAGTKIVSLGSGTGGTGTYTVSPSQSASSTSMTAGAASVSFDSQSGAFIVTGGSPGAEEGAITFATGTASTALMLTAATGAVISQGADQVGVSDPTSPSVFMNGVTAVTTNWATLVTIFEPVAADKVAFADWVNGQNNRFIYAMWDTDITATESNDSASAGAIIIAKGDSGTVPIYEPSDLNHGAFVAGYFASIDFTQPNGRVTLAYRRQQGLAVGVTNETIAGQLLLNGYNFYGEYSTSNADFNLFQNGSITGPFAWADSYANQIWLSAQLQLALLTLLQQTFSIPYNQEGYNLIAAAAADPINAALSFGAIRAGVTLSQAEIAEVNNAAGIDVATTLQNRGWYLQIKDADPSVRVARGSPPITFWYMDGQSVQKITLDSVEIQ